MASELDIAKARASDMTNQPGFDLQIPALETDAAQNQKETEWLNTKWSQYWGKFNAVPDLKSAILMKAIWNVGKG